MPYGEDLKRITRPNVGFSMLVRSWGTPKKKLILIYLLFLNKYLMMLPESWKKEIVGLDKGVDWVFETAKQLVKDFKMMGLLLNIELLNEHSYQHLFDEAKLAIKNLVEKDYALLLSLLYRIDLPEKELEEAIKTSLPNELHIVLTTLILRREFAKVVLKHRYSL